MKVFPFLSAASAATVGSSLLVVLFLAFPHSVQGQANASDLDYYDPRQTWAHPGECKCCGWYSNADLVYVGHQGGECPMLSTMAVGTSGKVVGSGSSLVARDMLDTLKEFHMSMYAYTVMLSFA